MLYANVSVFLLMQMQFQEEEHILVCAHDFGPISMSKETRPKAELRQ